MKIYYDNGQVEASKILSSVFNTMLPNPIFHMVNNLLSKSEKAFWGNIRDLKKNYLKPLNSKEWS